MSESDAGRAVTEERFREELRSLIEAAHEDGLSINQHWTCRTGDGVPDWEVEFVRLQEQSD